MAVIQFNKGFRGLLDVLNQAQIQVGVNTVSGFAQLDEERITESKRHSLSEPKSPRLPDLRYFIKAESFYADVTNTGKNDQRIWRLDCGYLRRITLEITSSIAGHLVQLQPPARHPITLKKNNYTFVIV
ncbi:hypothetical protein TNCV_4494461 [Trichonephila clavipes]|nr:hypothetical protein TNCV_4494461 [Trichonephila clavipes]